MLSAKSQHTLSFPIFVSSKKIVTRPIKQDHWQLVMYAADMTLACRGMASTLLLKLLAFCSVVIVSMLFFMAWFISNLRKEWVYEAGPMWMWRTLASFFYNICLIWPLFWHLGVFTFQVCPVSSLLRKNIHVLPPVFVVCYTMLAELRRRETGKVEREEDALILPSNLLFQIWKLIRKQVWSFWIGLELN